MFPMCDFLFEPFQLVHSLASLPNAKKISQRFTYRKSVNNNSENYKSISLKTITSCTSKLHLSVILTSTQYFYRLRQSTYLSQTIVSRNSNQINGLAFYCGCQLSWVLCGNLSRKIQNYKDEPTASRIT